MALLSSVRFFAQLNNLSLLESVSGKQLSINGSEDISIDTDLGLTLKEGQSVFMPDSQLSVSNAMTLSFSFSPVNFGVARTSNGNSIENMSMPILVIGNGVQDIYTENFEITDDYLIVYELAQSNGKNRLAVKMFDASDNEYVMTMTEDYDVSQRRHVWFVYDGGGGTATLHLDGETKSVSEEGSVPSTIPASIASVWFSELPSSMPAAYNTMKHLGVIDDVLIANETITTAATIQESVNFSTLRAFDSEFTDLEEVDCGFVFNDPSPVKVRSMRKEGSYFYIGRSDGKLLRGTPLFWQSRRDYADANESNALDAFGDSGASISDGALTISSGTVRL